MSLLLTEDVLALAEDREGEAALRSAPSWLGGDTATCALFTPDSDGDEQ